MESAEVSCSGYAVPVALANYVVSLFAVSSLNPLTGRKIRKDGVQIDLATHRALMSI